jgi:hypothetical protein
MARSRSKEAGFGRRCERNSVQVQASAERGIAVQVMAPRFVGPCEQTASTGITTVVQSLALKQLWAISVSAYPPSVVRPG